MIVLLDDVQWGLVVPSGDVVVGILSINNNIKVLI